MHLLEFSLKKYDNTIYINATMPYMYYRCYELDYNDKDYIKNYNDLLRVKEKYENKGHFIIFNKSIAEIFNLNFDIINNENYKIIEKYNSDDEVECYLCEIKIKRKDLKNHYENDEEHSKNDIEDDLRGSYYLASYAGNGSPLTPEGFVRKNLNQYYDDDNDEYNYGNYYKSSKSYNYYENNSNCKININNENNDINLYNLTVKKLQKKCKEHNISGYSKLKKNDLIKLLDKKIPIIKNDICKYRTKYIN